jgi:hypothetical protein
MTAVQSTIKLKTRSNPDADLLDMVKHHDELWPKLGGDDDDDLSELSSEVRDLERQIVARPVFTQEGLIAKERVVARAAFDDDDRIIREIMRLDHQRVTG